MPYKHTTKSGKRDMRYKRENNPFFSKYSDSTDYFNVRGYENPKKKRPNYILILIPVAILVFAFYIVSSSNKKKAETQIQMIEAENSRLQAERNAEAQNSERQRIEEEKKVAESRAITLENATIIGYKPCFNIGASRNYSPYELHDKIAVVGYLENRYNNFGNEFRIMPINYNNDQKERLELVHNTNLTSLANLFPSIEKAGSNGSMNSYYCIFFLTKTYENDISKYILNNYIFLGDIVGKTKDAAGKPDVKQNILEDWVINNYKNQTIQFLKTVTPIAEKET